MIFSKKSFRLCTPLLLAAVLFLAGCSSTAELPVTDSEEPTVTTYTDTNGSTDSSGDTTETAEDAASKPHETAVQAEEESLSHDEKASASPGSDIREPQATQPSVPTTRETGKPTTATTRRTSGSTSRPTAPATTKKPAATTTNRPTTAPTSSGSNASFAKQVLDLVNAERAKAGLSALSWNQQLADGAAIRAVEIQQQFSHTRPNGESCFTVIDGGFRTMGENIAAGYRTPEAVVNGWMNSEGHRKNILSANFKYLGVAVQNNHWVQLFGG